jgi:hypothetical protein
MWRHSRHVGVPLTKDFSLASIVMYTNMAAMPYSWFTRDVIASMLVEIVISFFCL